MTELLNRPLMYLGLSLLLFIGACTVGKSAPSRFYILSPLPDQKNAVGTLEGKDEIIIGIGPVEIPPYLDRPQIVTRHSDNEIKLPEFDKWGEDLVEGIFRVLSENLSGLLSSRSIVVTNLKSSRSIDYLIQLNVIRLDGYLGGDVHLIADWAILGKQGKQFLLSGRSDFVEASEGPDYESFVKAQSIAIGRLSKKIADGITSLTGKKD